MPKNHLLEHGGGTNGIKTVNLNCLSLGGLRSPGNLAKSWGASPPHLLAGVPRLPGLPGLKSLGFLVLIWPPHPLVAPLCAGVSAVQQSKLLQGRQCYVWRPIDGQGTLAKPCNLQGLARFTRSTGRNLIEIRSDLIHELLGLHHQSTSNQYGMKESSYSSSWWHKWR